MRRKLRLGSGDCGQPPCTPGTDPAASPRSWCRPHLEVGNNKPKDGLSREVKRLSSPRDSQSGNGGDKRVVKAKSRTQAFRDHGDTEEPCRAWVLTGRGDVLY